MQNEFVVVENKYAVYHPGIPNGRVV